MVVGDGLFCARFLNEWATGLNAGNEANGVDPGPREHEEIRNGDQG